MKHKFALILTQLVLLGLTPAWAAQPATNPPAKGPNPANGRGLPFHGNVAAVDNAGKTITMRGEKHRVFYVTPQTKINKNKIQTTLNAVAVGDYVGGYAREKADGKLELVTLNVGEAVGKKTDGK